MPEQDSGTGELQHAEEVLDVILPARDEATEVVEPGEELRHFETDADARAWVARDIAAQTGVQ